MDIHELPSTNLTMECPFTWQLDLQKVCDFCEEDKTLADYTEAPISCYIQMVTFAYIRYMQGRIVAAEELIEQINDLWERIYESVSEQKVYSIDVLMHIKDATAYHIYSMIGKKEKAKEMEMKIKDANNFKSDIEKGTIVGCQALATKLLDEKKQIPDISLKLAKLASSYVPNCALWHYVIAECLRMQRRFHNFSANISEEETNEYLKCYELSESDHFYMCVARLYRESNNWEKCSDMYNSLYLKEPTSLRTRLSLVLFFLSSKDFVKAKDCLDYIEKILPPKKSNKTYYHYLARYYEKTRNYPKAKENYLKAIGTNNFPADMDYLILIRNTSNSKYDYEVIKHLKSMLNRYKDNKSLTVHIMLTLAITYLFKNKNLKLAADYFLKAIQTNPHDPQLENFQTRFRDVDRYNIFELISSKILTGNEDNYGNTLQELKNHCIKYKNRKENNVSDLLSLSVAETLSLNK
ncbi:uncharacterized protein LOC106658377 [Trichogramma pretiosum]|uniref:uncharacterized protein LOC106658377 n=1 Tax=Trichogramma pretiosum TaxID=7493 RepID=UPI0006C9A7CA|nr:uncharacterized protein LOC106658377 [Trichogramma pretiosum]